jgi:hypothetical protein
MNRYEKMAKDSIDDFLESRPFPKSDASMDAILKTILTSPWRKDIQDHLAGCIENAYGSHPNGDPQSIAADTFFDFHKAFRQIGIIDPIKWKKQDESLSVNYIIWQILASKNSSLQYHIKFQITGEF